MQNIMQNDQRTEVNNQANQCDAKILYELVRYHLGAFTKYFPNFF